MRTGRTEWVGAKEIAHLLNITPATFHRNLTRLTAEEAFPLPSPHRLKPRTWRRQAVENWIDSQGYSRAELAGVPPGTDSGGKVHLLRMAGAG